MLRVSGLVRLCKPDGSGLQSLIGVLYLPYHETRVHFRILLKSIFCMLHISHADIFSYFHLEMLGLFMCPMLNCLQREILDMLFDVFRFQVPAWTDNFAEALLSIGKTCSVEV